MLELCYLNNLIDTIIIIANPEPKVPDAIGNFPT